MIYNVNLGDTYAGDPPVNTSWSLQQSKKGNYFFERKDIHCRIQIPRLDDPGPLVGTRLGDGYIIPADRIFATYTNNLAPYFRREQDVTEGDIVYITLDSTVKLINYKTPYDIRYTYRGRPGKNHVSQYQGCVIVLHEEEELKDLPIFELILKISDGSFESVKVILNKDENQIVVNRYPIYKKKTLDIFTKIDNDKRLPRFRIKIEHGHPCLTGIWVVKDSMTEEQILDLLFDNLPYGVAQHAVVMNIESMDDLGIRTVFRLHSEKNESQCFTMVDDAEIPYELWKELKQNYVFKYNSETGKLTCLKSV